MEHRLNVKGTTKKSVMYAGYHLAEATLSSGEAISVVGTGVGIALETGKEHDYITMFIPYEELVREALKVL